MSSLPFRCCRDCKYRPDFPRVPVLYALEEVAGVYLSCSLGNKLTVVQIDERHDPRDNHITISDDDSDHARTHTNTADNRPPRHPLQHHNPWQADPPDPDEPDIEHVEWNPAPGIHFTRTSYRSTTPGQGPRSQGDPFAPIFQSFSTMFEGGSNAPGRPPEPPHIHHPNGMHRLESAPQNPFPDHHHHHVHHHHHDPWGPNGPPGGRHGFTATARWPPDGAPGPMPGNRTGNNIHAYVHHSPSLHSRTLHARFTDIVVRTRMLATLLQSMQTGLMEQGNGPQNGMNNMQAFISSILGNGTHGDAVYTDEALDRIITQMMEQQNGNSAPGPASAAAIAALPKQKVDKSMLGQDGKAECSVCMDVVEIGDEVTVLPCKHWFHGDCVGAWLKEHDTCPHCRQGIMPKDAPETADTPRSPDQEPRNSQNIFAVPRPSPPTEPGQQPPMPGAFTQTGMQQPYVPGGFRSYPEPQDFVVPPAQQQGQSSNTPPTLSQQVQQHRESQRAHRRRSSARERSSGNGGEGSSSGQGVTGWFRRLGGGSGSGDR